MQRIALCRSRRELSNAYFLAKFGFDTAENEPSKVCPIEPSRMRAGDGGARHPAGGWVRPGLLPGRAAKGRRHLLAPQVPPLQRDGLGLRVF